MTDSETSFGTYRRVFILGIDGMGNFNRLTDTPNMDALFAEGATSYNVLASRPTISAECWTSMLTGATPKVHGLTNSDMHPIEGLPTLFGMARASFPEAELAAFCDWSPIGDEIITPSSGVNRIDTGADDRLTERLLEYLDTNEPKLLFVQFDSVDDFGHTYGYGTKEHLERITHVDGMLGRIVEKYRERGFFDDTLFLVSADHGGTSYGSHGGWSEEEKYVFLGVTGKNVMKGEIGTSSLRDFPAIVLWALGISAPEFDPDGYASQMPVGIFKDAGVADRYPVIPSPNLFEASEEPARGTKEHIDNFIDPEAVALNLNFENGIEDASGHCRVTPSEGIIKRYGNGFRGFCGEFGSGSLEVEGVHLSDTFTFMFWMRTVKESWSRIDLFTTRDGENPYFTLSAYGDLVQITLREANRRLRGEYMITGNENHEPGGWEHFMFTVEPKIGRITAYANFGTPTVTDIGTPIDNYFRFDKLLCGYDKSANGIYRTVDDLMIVNGRLDPKTVAAYYGTKPE